MVVRRFREHVAEHNWFAVAVDVLIVVLGVFIGTQVSNWNDDRLEAAEGREYAKRLLKEVTFNGRMFAQRRAYYRQVRQYGLDTLADLEGRTRLDDRSFLLAAYQLSQTDLTPPKTATYDAILARDLENRVGDEVTQRMASDYYLNLAAREPSMRDIPPYRSLIRQVMPYPLQRTIRYTCGDVLVQVQGQTVGNRLPVGCTFASEAKAVADGARIVRSTPGIAEAVVRYLASLDEKEDLLRSDLSESDALRRRIAAAAH